MENETSSSNIESDIKLTKKSQALYDAINRYYMLLLDSISLEDYNSMKEMLGYTDEYEDHINEVKSHIKQESSTIDKIKNFISIYSEFQRKHYANMIQSVCDEIEKNPSLFKQEAYKGILDIADELNNYDNSEDMEDEDMDNEDMDNEDVLNDVDKEENVSQETDDNSENEESIYYVCGTEIMIKTYGDPLFRNLCNILFIVYERENAY